MYSSENYKPIEPEPFLTESNRKRLKISLVAGAVVFGLYFSTVGISNIIMYENTFFKLMEWKNKETIEQELREDYETELGEFGNFFLWLSKPGREMAYREYEKGKK